MGQMFRPVQELWGESSSSWIGHHNLVGLLCDLAARADVSWEDHEYSDTTVVWMEDGKKVLDYIEFDARFNVDSFSESLNENGYEIDPTLLGYLLENMKSLAGTWRNSLGKHGELNFYVD